MRLSDPNGYGVRDMLLLETRGIMFVATVNKGASIFNSEPGGALQLWSLGDSPTPPPTIDVNSPASSSSPASSPASSPRSEGAVAPSSPYEIAPVTPASTTPAAAPAGRSCEHCETPSTSAVPVFLCSTCGFFSGKPVDAPINNPALVSARIGAGAGAAPASPVAAAAALSDANPALPAGLESAQMNRMWLDKTKVTVCMNKDCGVSMSRGKTHCRHCGQVFCSKVSEQTPRTHARRFDHARRLLSVPLSCFCVPLW